MKNLKTKYSILFAVILLSIFTSTVATPVLADEGEVIKINTEQFKSMIMN